MQLQKYEKREQSLQVKALLERSFMNIDTGYNITNTSKLLLYEVNVHSKAEHRGEIKIMMAATKNHEYFEVYINDNGYSTSLNGIKRTETSRLLLWLERPRHNIQHQQRVIS